MTQDKKAVVFVDPQDTQAKWWWPAMIVSHDELTSFHEAYETEASPKEGELLVCYFEDSSFSIVEEKDTRPFALDAAPYSEYMTSNFAKNFVEDDGVNAALDYLRSGIIPEDFTWLSDAKSLKKTFSTSNAQKKEQEDLDNENIIQSNNNNNSNKVLEDSKEEKEAEPTSLHPINKKRLYCEMIQGTTEEASL